MIGRLAGYGDNLYNTYSILTNVAAVACDEGAMDTVTDSIIVTSRYF